MYEVLQNQKRLFLFLVSKNGFFLMSKKGFFLLTAAQKDLKATGTWIAGTWMPTKGPITPAPSQATIAAQIDNSDNRVTTVMTKNEMALRAGNDYWTARLFLEDNLRATT